MANKTEVKFLAKPVNHLYMLIISAGALTTLGLIMVFSASSIRAIDTQGSAISIVLRQLLFVLVSVPLAAYLSKLTVAKWEFLARIGFLLSLCILATLLIPGVGKTVNGNTNWVDLKIVDVQPSEFAKFLMILWASYLLARKENSGRFDTNVFSLIGPGFILIMAMIMYGHDLGTTSVIAAILAGLLFISGIPLRLFGTITAVGALILAAFIATSPYRAARFLVFLNPFAPEDYKYAGWQPAHSLLGLASGGLFGVGLGGSRQKWGNLAEAHTDFIFSVIGEELGLVGTLTVLLLLLTMIYSTFRIALRAKEPMIRYACAGIGCWITVQAFLNIGSATSVLPVVGVTLPLVSYGGSALVATLCALGFVAGAALRDPAVRKEILKRRTQ
ncbi:MAG: putative lipid II flippase FtsW [Candidatus Planktophila sp.]|jgi:cell division protein FtsW